MDTQAYALNNKGQAVGRAWDEARPRGTDCAFIFSVGVGIRELQPMPPDGNYTNLMSRALGIGWLQAHGLGTATSVSEARKWYAKSAEQGYARAEEALQRLPP